MTRGSRCRAGCMFGHQSRADHWHSEQSGRMHLMLAVALALLLALLWAGGAWWQRRAQDAVLLRTEPAQLLRSPVLVRYAVSRGEPVYRHSCAGCHGAQRRGDARRGVPALASHNWLYGDDLVGVEHIVLYGIRSGHPQARNLTDMPALVRTGQITDQDARDAVEYLLQLSGRTHDAAAAERGRAIYLGKGNCYDCHASDAAGVIDYGTPPLTGPEWLYGGDRDTLLQSIANGRHGKCPAHTRTLSPAQARAVAVYLVTARH